MVDLTQFETALSYPQHSRNASRSSIANSQEVTLSLDFWWSGLPLKLEQVAAVYLQLFGTKGSTEMLPVDLKQAKSIVDTGHKSSLQVQYMQT